MSGEDFGFCSHPGRHVRFLFAPAVTPATAARQRPARRDKSWPVIPRNLGVWAGGGLAQGLGSTQTLLSPAGGNDFGFRSRPRRRVRFSCPPAVTPATAPRQRPARRG